MLDQTVKLLLGIFIFVLLSANSDSHLSGNISNALAPEESIQASVNSHILRDLLNRRELTLVNISFCAKPLISLTALGALLLNYILWSLL